MAQHWSRWCWRSGDQTIGTDSQSGGFDDQIGDNHHRSNISNDRTAKTYIQNNFFGYWTSNTNCDVAPLVIGPPPPVFSVASPTMKPLVSIASEGSPTTKLPTSVARAKRWPSDYMGEGKPLCVFGNCFTKFSKVQLFLKDFTVNRKCFTSLTIFYMQTNTWKWENIF